MCVSCYHWILNVRFDATRRKVYITIEERRRFSDNGLVGSSDSCSVTLVLIKMCQLASLSPLSLRSRILEESENEEGECVKTGSSSSVAGA